MKDVNMHLTTKFTNKIIVVFTVMLISLLFIGAYSMRDPDFGWHLKVGEILVSSREIPKTDPFSYTMSSFPFISHEWLTDIYLYKMFDSLGTTGLAFIFGTYLALTLLISSLNSMSRKINKSIKQSALLLTIPLSINIILNYYGIRPQVQSWLLFSILFYLLLNPKLWKRFKLLLIPLFVFWVNLHGSFAAATLTVSVYVVFKFIRTRTINWFEFFLVLMLILATFVNPYGPRIWVEIWMTASDSHLKWTIQEWQPSILSFNPALLIMATLTTFLLVKYRSKFLLEEKVLYFFFLFQAISSTRHVPLWLILQIPFFVVSANYLYKEIKPIPMATQRLTKMYKVFLTFVVLLSIFEVTLYFFHINKYSVTDQYPVGAVTYLKENTPSDQIFSPYNWGGYLIWEYPQKKLYIDGRMPSWRWDGAPESESDYAMRDYKDLLSGEIDYKLEFEKYGIDTVLWFAPKEESLYEKMDNIIYKFLERFTPKNGDKKALIESLKDDGWIVVYEDDTALIYQKP